IEQTIGQKRPKGFQRAEFLLEHGFIDAILERETSRETLAEILRLHGAEQDNAASTENTSEELHEEMEGGIPDELKDAESGLTAWERVEKARKKDRPVGTDYIQALFEGFQEFHGDRGFRDDPAIVGGIAWFHDRPVTVIAEAKGTTTKENVKRNFGMPYPEGYWKALRLMKQAEKFHRPVICFVDTPGAFCGMEAEERGQGEAIARNLFEMSDLKTPILSLVIGEGGSGGALAL